MRFIMAAGTIMLVCALTSEGYAITTFGEEIQVKSSNSTGWESDQDLAVDTKGRLYMAWENDSLMGFNKGIIIYRSVDKGLSWSFYAYLFDPDADLLQPSIAVGEGLGNKLLVAYLKDDGGPYVHPEVAVASLGSTNFTITPLGASTMARFEAPEIWTDSSQHNIWRAYITCVEFDMFNGTKNIVSWRSEPYGQSWSSTITVEGGTISTQWSRPCAAFGTPSKKHFIVCCMENTKEILLFTSTNSGQSWSHSKLITSLGTLPAGEVNPQVAAARFQPNVLVCFVERSAGYDDIVYCDSKDSGNQWTIPTVLPDNPGYDRLGPELTANDSGYGSFHLTYTVLGWIYHHSRYLNLGTGWDGPHIVNDHGKASEPHHKKGIACNPDTDAAYICWCDYHDNNPLMDTDTYFSYSGSLVGDHYKISASTGGSCELTLNAGLPYMNRNYLILGSLTGISPGMPLPGGHATLPLNWDLFTDLVVKLSNTSVFTNFHGSLNSLGAKAAQLYVPPLNPKFVGVKMYYAYCLYNPFNFASNAVAVEIVN